MNVEPEMYNYTNNNWSHWNSNEKLKEKFGSCTRKTFDRFITKDSYTWNITHNTESTAVWSLKPERWGSPLVQEKYWEKKTCDKRHSYLLLLLLLLLFLFFFVQILYSNILHLKVSTLSFHQNDTPDFTPTYAARANDINMCMHTTISKTWHDQLSASMKHLCNTDNYSPHTIGGLRLTYKMTHAMADSSATQGLFQFLDHVCRNRKSTWNQYLSAQTNSAE